MDKWIAVLLLLSLPWLARATDGSADRKPEEEGKREAAALRYDVIVTATRTAKDVFTTAQPVAVVNREEAARQAPDSVTSLMQAVPGLDAVGVGPSQTRPIIRGMRGQRILLLEDGIRLNNSRRNQDFGEIPGMVDVDDVEAVEVVRGPASVLYGSDAVGGVINVLSLAPRFAGDRLRLRGRIGYQYDSGSGLNRFSARVAAGRKRLAVWAGGSVRRAGEYEVPAGRFGAVTLASPATVTDSRVEDGNARLALSWQASDRVVLTFKADAYRSDFSGFGYVDPALYAPGGPTIRITYPDQHVQKYVLRARHSQLDFAPADMVDVTLYLQGNRRHLDMDIFVPFGIPDRPAAGVSMQTWNYTRTATAGGRLEFTKSLGGRHLLVYGADFFRDASTNTDRSSTAVVGLGPVRPVVSGLPQVPNARYVNRGLFVQDEWRLHPRLTATAGLRYQDVLAATLATPGLEGEAPVSDRDATLVGAASLLLRLGDDLAAYLSAGRAFRSPNLVERFFAGPTPEGNGTLTRNPGLQPETSFQLDAGLRWRRPRWALEAAVFRNMVYDGIRTAPTGGFAQGLAEYRYVNVDKLRVQGVEFQGQALLPLDIRAVAGFSSIRARDIYNPDQPFSSSYSSRLTLDLLWQRPGGRVWLAYNLRWQGKQKDIVLVENPVGDFIPGFVVQAASAGATLVQNDRAALKAGLVLANVTDTLYAEAANSPFFRPAPGRRLVVTWSLEF